MSEKILISDKISEDGLAVFERAGIPFDHFPEITQDEIKERIGEYTGWVIRSRSRATADIIERAERLRVIGRAGVGVDNVDTAAATRKGVIVMNTPGGNTTSTAEHTVSMLLSIARKIPQACASMRKGEWDKKSFMGVEIAGKTLGIFGLGRIGQEVVKRLRAFEMHVLGYDPFLSHDRMKALGIEPTEIDEICRRADFITVHTPLSPETKDLINARRFNMMKKSVHIVNCARGGIINEQDLYDALKSGKIAGAAIDVFCEEPLIPDSPFRKLDNCIITPHIAASTIEAQENVAIQVAEQVVDVLRGGPIRNALNAPSVDPEILPIIGPYMALMEKMGSFISQFTQGRVVKLTCRYSGSVLDHPLPPLTTSAVIGLLRPTSESPVNFVNATQILRERGIELMETRHSEQYQYENLMTIEIQLEDGSTHYVSGTLFARQRARIVIVNDKHFDAVPEGTMVVIENNDVPGIIGRVGTVFGNHGVNIGQLTWGRTQKDNTAMTIINIDTQINQALLDEIAKLPDIMSVRLIKL